MAVGRVLLAGAERRRRMMMHHIATSAIAGSLATRWRSLLATLAQLRWLATTGGRRHSRQEATGDRRRPQEASSDHHEGRPKERL